MSFEQPLPVSKTSHSISLSLNRDSFAHPQKQERSTTLVQALMTPIGIALVYTAGNNSTRPESFPFIS